MSERYTNFVRKFFSKLVNLLCLDTGYAFSGNEGNSTLVTDNLTNRLKEAVFKQFYGDMFESTTKEGKLEKLANQFSLNKDD